MGGEKLPFHLDLLVLTGSPPRGRGKEPLLSVYVPAPGITPAWAGKSFWKSASKLRFWDHPRVGGEKLYCIAALFSMWGSPPRGRGKGPHLRKQAVRGGITPAWAGKRVSDILGQLFGGDHPRVGGEKTLFSGFTVAARGSPPRGRGKVVKAPSKRCNLRITPAWAGKRWQQLQAAYPSRDHPRVGGEKYDTPTGVISL